jgi:hypothetical protein
MGRRKPTRTRRPRQAGANAQGAECTPADLFPPGTIIQYIVGAAAKAHALSMAEGMNQRPSPTALKAGTPLAHTRPFYRGEDAEKGITDLSCSPPPATPTASSSLGRPATWRSPATCPSTPQTRA